MDGRTDGSTLIVEKDYIRFNLLIKSLALLYVMDIGYTWMCILTGGGGNLRQHEGCYFMYIQPSKDLNQKQNSIKPSGTYVKPPTVENSICSVDIKILSYRQTLLLSYLVI